MSGKKEKKPEIVVEDSFRKILTLLVKEEVEDLSAKEQAEIVSDLLAAYQASWLALIQASVNHHLDLTLDPPDDEDEDEDEDDEDDA